MSRHIEQSGVEGPLAIWRREAVAACQSQRRRGAADAPAPSVGSVKDRALAVAADLHPGVDVRLEGEGQLSVAVLVGDDLSCSGSPGTPSE